MASSDADRGSGTESRRASSGSEARDEPRTLALSQVLDHAILDRCGRRAGRVDDVLLEVRQVRKDEAPTIVLRAVVSGPLSRPAPRLLRVLAVFLYRLIGVARPEPAFVDWSHVTAIDALLHLDVDRHDAGLRAVDDACDRIVRKLPGGEAEP